MRSAALFSYLEGSKITLYVKLFEFPQKKTILLRITKSVYLKFNCVTVNVHSCAKDFCEMNNDLKVQISNGSTFV